MNIHQVNVSYISEQDRFLLKINSAGGEELRLWFTRRLTLGLLPILDKSAGDQMKRQIEPLKSTHTLEQRREELLDKFKREAAIFNADFATPYRDTPEALPLGPEPLLVTEVQLTSLSSGHLQVKLIEKIPTQTRDVQINMDAQLTQGLLYLLHQAIKKSQWLELPPQALALGKPGQDRVEFLNAEASGEPAEDSLQTDGLANGKTRYLN